jgi:hypothetical protein
MAPGLPSGFGEFFAPHAFVKPSNARISFVLARKKPGEISDLGLLKPLEVTQTCTIPAPSEYGKWSATATPLAAGCHRR